MFVSKTQASNTTEMNGSNFSIDQRVDILAGSKMQGGTENEKVTSPTLAAPSQRGSAQFLPTGVLTRVFIPALTHQTNLTGGYLRDNFLQPFRVGSSMQNKKRTQAVGRRRFCRPKCFVKTK
jgi:hypothetical protein